MSESSHKVTSSVKDVLKEKICKRIACIIAGLVNEDMASEMEIKTRTLPDNIHTPVCGNHTHTHTPKKLK
jgi:hypothetical protein